MNITDEILKQRIEIANDVMAQIELKHYKVKEGVYVELDECELVPAYSGGANTSSFVEMYGDDLQQALQKLPPDTKTCVCAIGSLILSAAKLYDNIYVTGLSATFEALSPWFSLHELALIELAFEGWEDLEGGMLVNHYSLARDVENVRDFKAHVVVLEAEDEGEYEDITAGEIESCWDFYNLHEDDPEKRLYAIMQNIVVCGGYFRP